MKCVYKQSPGRVFVFESEDSQLMGVWFAEFERVQSPIWGVRPGRCCLEGHSLYANENGEAVCCRKGEAVCCLVGQSYLLPRSAKCSCYVHNIKLVKIIEVGSDNSDLQRNDNM